FISSSIVRSIIRHGGDASHLYPKEIDCFMKGNGSVHTV
ncbi:MAG: hypothetical protein LBG67_01230, partial [Campylobacteraceae bacterium]|nr:hypothetical protein [Campylobacteraceae bacterium]